MAAEARYFLYTNYDIIGIFTSSVMALPSNCQVPLGNFLSNDGSPGYYILALWRGKIENGCRNKLFLVHKQPPSRYFFGTIEPRAKILANNLSVLE